MATEYDDSQDWTFFIRGPSKTLTNGNGFATRWSEQTVAALRSVGFLDNMIDGTVPPVDTSMLWLDKNTDPAVLKEYNPVGAAWEKVTSQTLFGRVPWRGPWDDEPIYRRGDVVSYNGAIWICILPSQNHPPAEDAYWDLFIPALPDNSVTTAKIVDSAVTAAKLADGAVTTPKIADGAVTRQKVSGDFIIQTVANRAEMKTLDISQVTSAFLKEGGREGVFKWTAGNFSTQIAADTQEGVYIKANAVASSVGAWVRANWQELDPHWFGCVGDNSTDDAAAFQAMVDFIATVQPERKVIALGSAKYLLNSEIIIPPPCLQLVMYGNNPYASQFRSSTITAGQIFSVYAQGCSFQDFRTENDTFDVSSVARDGFVLTKSYGFTEAFAAASVNVTTDTITVASNTKKWLTGFPVQMTTSGVLPTGVSALTDYYVIRTSATTIKLATSFANAVAGVAIDITAAGSGTHTILSKPECDIDAEFHNVEISRFRYGINPIGRGLRVENSLVSVCYNPISLNYPDVGTYTPGPNVQEDLAGFRGIYITDNRFHSNTAAGVANKGTNAAKINGLVIVNNLVDIGRPVFDGHLGIGGSLISGNVINETPLEGIILTGGFDYMITGNTIAGSEGIAGGDRIPDSFISSTGTHDSGVISGNLFKRCKSHGLDFRSGAFTNMVIMDNVFLDPCRDIGSFCPIVFVGGNHSALVKENVVVTTNSLTGIVRGDTGTSSILTITNRVMGANVPEFVGSGQAATRGMLGSAASPYDTIYVKYLALTDAIGTATPTLESTTGKQWISGSDGDLKIQFGDNTVKTIVVDT